MYQSKTIGSTILNRFEVKGVLGQGAYGQVVLTESKGKQSAIKKISKKALMRQKQLIDYLKGEVECMKSIKSPFIMELEEVNEDEEFMYIVCEYCNGGNLKSYQLAMPHGRFTVPKAFEVLAYVLRGLQGLHMKGYLHRDIKPENVLVKKQNDSEVFKLADFGFSKKKQDATGTILGTIGFMAPEVYQNSKYGFGVDMWAVGVMLYYMLTGQLPFETGIATSSFKVYFNRVLPFSFKKSLTSINKLNRGGEAKPPVKSDPLLQQLFKNIFALDPKERLSFHKLKEHPYMKEYFNPEDIEYKNSFLMYGSEFTGREFDPMDFIRQILQRKLSKNLDVVYEKNQDGLDQQIDHVENIMDEHLFILKLADYFSGQIPHKYLPAGIPEAIKYSLTKYYIVTARKYRDDIQYRIVPKQFKYHGLEWTDFWSTKSHRQHTEEVIVMVNNAESNLVSVYADCKKHLKQIFQISPEFSECFRDSVTEKEFDEFKCSLRSITVAANRHLNELQNNAQAAKKPTSGLIGLRVRVLMAHMINRIFDRDEIDENFSIFGEWLKKQGKIQPKGVFNFKLFDEWLNAETEKNIVKGTNFLLRKYFNIRV